MSRIGTDDAGTPIPATRQGAVQNVAYTGTAGQSAAFGPATTLIRIVATTACYYLVGTNPAATTSNGSYLPSGAVDFVIVTPSSKISVIRDSASGSLNITEC